MMHLRIPIVLLLLSCWVFNSCISQQYRQSVQKFEFEYQGESRLYLVHLPPPEKMKQPLPVLFHIHGGGGTAMGTVGLTFGRFNELADRDGFIVVYPEAIGKNWNDGRKVQLNKSFSEKRDDVGYFAEVVNRLKKNYSIDENQIFAAGMSNGGFMTARLLCDRADLFRGGAILTATLAEDYVDACQPSQPVGVLVMNGTDDNLVPYEGGDIKLFKRSKSRGKIISTDDCMELWQKHNNCQEKSAPVALPDLEKDGTRIFKTSYSNCDPGGALVLYRIEGGGHTWAGGKQYLGEKLIGKTSRDINACDVIWEFFQGL